MKPRAAPALALASLLVIGATPTLAQGALGDGYERGVAALRAGRVYDAIDALRPVAEAEPRFRDVQLQLGQAYLVVGLHTAAKACFERALADAPGNGLAALLLGLSLHSAERHKEATAALDRAVQLAPGNPHPRIYRGWSLTRLGRLDEAAADLDQAERIAPGEATLVEARAELALARGDARDAERRLRELAERQQLTLGQRILLARAQLAAGRPDDARNAIEPIVDTDRPRSDTLYLLAQAQLRSGDREAGRATLARFEEQRAREQEIRLLEVTVNSDPEDDDAAARLIALLLANGQPGEARLRWTALARRRPGDRQVGELGERVRAATR